MSDVNEGAIHERVEKVEKKYQRRQAELNELQQKCNQKRSQMERLRGRWQVLKELLGEGDDIEDLSEEEVDETYEEVKQDVNSQENGDS